MIWNFILGLTIGALVMGYIVITEYTPIPDNEWGCTKSEFIGETYHRREVCRQYTYLGGKK